MLSEEELIPVKPIAADEFTSWSEAAATVKRFHEFFNKCKEALGLALAASRSRTRRRHAYAYQDYLWDDGDRIVVGIDAGEWGPRATPRRSGWRSKRNTATTGTRSGHASIAPRPRGGLRVSPGGGESDPSSGVTSTR